MSEDLEAKKTALAYLQQIDAETALWIYELVKTYCPSLIL
jgi:hypothetical protein